MEKIYVPLSTNSGLFLRPSLTCLGFFKTYKSSRKTVLGYGFDCLTILSKTESDWNFIMFQNGLTGKFIRHVRQSYSKTRVQWTDTLNVWLRQYHWCFGEIRLRLVFKVSPRKSVIWVPLRNFVGWVRAVLSYIIESRFIFENLTKWHYLY